MKFLEMVHLADRAERYPGELSGGMQQRVGIARAFAIEPDVLFMDEPFSHLDAITARTLRLELHQLWQVTGKTVLFVTHDVGEAVELSTRILVFAAGGRLEDDMAIGLDYPRDAADEQVALTKAGVLRKFEELNLIAS
jgi:NitT/TauT family transport system ATP-binding protein